DLRPGLLRRRLAAPAVAGARGNAPRAALESSVGRAPLGQGGRSRARGWRSAGVPDARAEPGLGGRRDLLRGAVVAAAALLGLRRQRAVARARYALLVASDGA